MNATSSTIQIPIISPDYVTLLERVNDINGTGLALANTFIALLAVVLTAVGIFVAYITWRNSREQKEERRKIYIEHEAQLAEQSRLLVATYEEKIKALLEKIEGIAETAETTGGDVTNTKRELETLVIDYQTRLNSLKATTQDDRFSLSTIDSIPMVKKKNRWQLDNLQASIGGIQDLTYETKKCPHCNKKYRINKYDSLTSAGLYADVCPHCDEEI